MGDNIMWKTVYESQPVGYALLLNKTKSFILHERLSVHFLGKSITLLGF
jgi:hypothetical protein